MRFGRRYRYNRQDGKKELIQLTQDRVEWRDFVSAVINLSFFKADNYFL
jgi:hypothetical protein